MKTICRRLLALLLVVMVTVLSPAMFVPTAEAVTVEATVEFAAKTVLSVVSSLAALGTGQYAVFAANTALYHSYVQDWLASGDVVVNEDTGEMTVSETARKQVWTWISTSETTNVGWYYLYPNASAKSWYYNRCVSSGKVPYYNLVQPHFFFYISKSGSSSSSYGYYDTCKAGVHYVRDKSSGASLYAYDSELKSVSCFKYSKTYDPQSVYESATYVSNTSSIYDTFTAPSTYYTEGAYIGNLPVKCWLNTSCLKLALANGDGYESYINSTAPSGDVVLNVDKVENTDWEVVNNQLYQNILEEVTEVGKDAITEEQLQEIIAEQTGKVEDAIEDGTKDIVAAIDDEVKWLKKINKNLENLNNTVTDGFNNVAELITTGGGESAVFDAEELIVAVTQLREALLSDNQEFSEQNQELIKKCTEIMEALNENTGNITAELDTIEKLMQDVVDNTSDEESTLNFKAKEIRDFLELLQIDVEELKEKYIELDVDVLNDLLNKWLTGTDKHAELLEDILEETKKSNLLLTADLLHDMFQDILDGDEDDSLLHELQVTFSPVVETASKKFPFSIPQNLYDLVVIFRAEPQVPIFELPLKVKSFDSEEYVINETFTVDLSKFQKLSQLARTFLSILFLVGIIYLTLRMGGGKDE